MASSYPRAPVSANLSAGPKPLFGFVGHCVPAMLIFAFTLVGAAPCFSRGRHSQDQKDQTQKEQTQREQTQKDQDVAEAARQERARKQTRHRKAKHVYTAEDLKRQHILTPEDRAAVEARKNEPALPGAPKPQDALNSSAVAPAANGESSSPNVPLGDVARRLRKQKQSEKLERSAEFHLPFANELVLASPKPPAQPLLPPARVLPPISSDKPAPSVAAPFRPFVKRSPFERPRVLPPSVRVVPRATVPSPSPVAPRLLTPPPPPLKVLPPRPAAPHAIGPALRTPAPHVLVPTPSAPRAIPVPPPAGVAASPLVSGKLATVTVQPGDSLWKFAAARLGNGRRWQELLSLNPELRNPDVIRIGSQIVVPASLAPRPTPTKYTVRSGDTLWSIAQSHFGHGASWSCIAQANTDLQDANLIRIGQLLLLPASCKPWQIRN
jgi:nucleoid-associated protein YgaU